ncbi:hypothetical protein AX16_004219 [Volvariella volvacea WC 439]|nr:hypothetical protein AX16_004219 [Volvariella volvacea WC 439]
MSPSSLLEGFDPFATHPFTNISGLMAPPPPPSQYPIPIPRKQDSAPHDDFEPMCSGNEDISTSSSPSSSQSISSSTSAQSSSSMYSNPPIHSPRAIPYAAMNTTLTHDSNSSPLDASNAHSKSQQSNLPPKPRKPPIFVPFRQEAASPDLVLKKKGQQRGMSGNLSFVKKQ